MGTYRVHEILERVDGTRTFSWHEIVEMKPYITDILEINDR